MRAFVVAAVLVISLSPLSACSQSRLDRACRPCPHRRAATAVPRAPGREAGSDGSVAGRQHAARDVGGSERRRRRRRQRARSLGARGHCPSNDRPAGREPAPYQPWAAKKVLEAFNRRGIDDPTGLCLPAGIPRIVMLGLFPQQFIQTPTQIVMLYEYMNVFRVIPLNAKHPDDIIPSYMGNSVARWEGDTLVVDVIGFNDKTWLSGTGTFHTDALHITERYTRVDKDQINYEVTMEDPNVLTKPWTLRSTLMLREGTRLQEIGLRREQHRSGALRKAAERRSRLHQAAVNVFIRASRTSNRSGPRRARRSASSGAGDRPGTRRLSRLDRGAGTRFRAVRPCRTPHRCSPIPCFRTESADALRRARGLAVWPAAVRRPG